MTRIRDKDDPQALSTESEREYIITESKLNEILNEVCKGATWTNYQRECVRSHPLAKAKPGDCPDCPILTGDDAKRFTEYINNPAAKSPTALELIRQARDLDKAPEHCISSCPCTVTKCPEEQSCHYLKEHDAQIARAATLAENRKWIDALNTLIATESVRLSPAMVNMVYSYRIAQIIESLRIQEPPE